MSSTTKHMDWFGWPSIVASFAVWHYYISVTIWVFAGVMEAHLFRMRRLEFVTYFLPYYAPAVVLMLLSCAAYYLALNRRESAWRVIALLAIATVAFFCLDVIFGRYQESYVVDTIFDYSRNSRWTHVYYTWFWFDDRILREVSEMLARNIGVFYLLGAELFYLLTLKMILRYNKLRKSERAGQKR